MPALCIRLVLFFSFGLQVAFMWYVLFFVLPVWLIIVLVAAFASALVLLVNSLLGRLLRWHIRSYLRDEARRAEMSQGW